MVQVKLARINQHWNLYFKTDEGYEIWTKNPEIKTSVKGDEGEFRLRKYHNNEIPIYGFGFWYYDKYKNRRPDHGREWSSNSSAINREFGTDLTEVAVDHLAVSVPLSWLKNLFGDSVVWGENKYYGEVITHVPGGSQPDSQGWITLQVPNWKYYNDLSQGWSKQ